MTNEQVTNTEGTKVESVVENSQVSDYEQSFAKEAFSDLNKTEEPTADSVSNGLENFGVEEESAPDLFNSDNENIETDSLLSTETKEILGNSFTYTTREKINIKGIGETRTYFIND